MGSILIFTGKHRLNNLIIIFKLTHIFYFYTREHCEMSLLMRTCHGEDSHPDVGDNYVQENCLASSPAKCSWTKNCKFHHIEINPQFDDNQIPKTKEKFNRDFCQIKMLKYGERKSCLDFVSFQECKDFSWNILNREVFLPKSFLRFKLQPSDWWDQKWNCMN